MVLAPGSAAFHPSVAEPALRRSAAAAAGASLRRRRQPARAPLPRSADAHIRAPLTAACLALTSPLLDPRPQVFQRMLDSPHPHAATHYAAFYSTTLGGITCEPGLMAFPADDHMAHRGHAVYDVVPITGGTLYQLDEHADRLAAAAEAVGIELPMAPAALKRVILDTAAASRKVNGASLFVCVRGPSHGIEAADGGGGA